jgi:GNAT superfamily N-acetyltransferase
VKIRCLEDQDLEIVSALCMDSFLQSVAETLSEEGVLAFTNVATSDAFRRRMQEDNLILVAEYDGRIEGVIELKEGRHIAMFFVAPKQQKKGVGRALMTSVLNNAKVRCVTVRASLPSVPAYRKYGFECSGEVGEYAGLVYQPMEIELNTLM